MRLVKTFLQRHSNIFAENQLLKFCFLALLVITIINSVSLYRVADSQRTVIIPAASGYQFELTDSAANEIYLRRMARYLVDLRANVTPSNVKIKFTELLKVVSAEQYGPFKENLMRLAAEFEQHRCISQYVIIDEHQPIKIFDHKTLTVPAIKYRVAGKEVVRKTPVIFNIGYRIEHGQFYLTGLYEQAQTESQHVDH